ncbi:MAG: POT family MFS transporter [Planctomycetaceae bacterium]
MSKYRTTPAPSTEMPKGIPYIVGNEAAERFSFYGMKAILYVFMTEHLLGLDGARDVMTKEQATFWVAIFVASAYFFPVLGAIVSDVLWGKYRTIIVLSLVYCLGHLALALDETRIGLAAGLTLIAVGAGGIKPCVSAHVGDQFGPQNQDLISKVFRWFYFSINLGAFASQLLTPLLLKWYGPGAAFGIPGVLMFLATVVFWLGRHEFIHVPPAGIGAVQRAFSGERLRAMLNLARLYVFVAVFWSLFDQSASRWVEQAKHMDRRWEIVGWFPASWDAAAWLPEGWHSFEWLASQLQFVNPALIMILIPVFSFVIYPGLNWLFPLTPLRKISIGLFVMVPAFALSAWIQGQIDAGREPDVAWQILAYVILTSSEVMVSITCLEFSYTQAPREVKSFIMSLYLLSVSAGNLLTAGVNLFIQNPDGTSKLPGDDYYWFFTAAMFLTAAAFIPAAMTYHGRTYIQGGDEKTAQAPVPGKSSPALFEE